MAIIDKSTDYFRIKLYTGNNNAQTIAWDETDTNMKPDMLWIKSYAGNTVFEHVLGNVVSGGGKYLVPNSAAVETSNGNVINTFNTNGFSVGGATQVSEGGRSYVAWGWKASNTTASNTAGSINSTVSVNTTAGFSVVSYTGTGANATVGHGLGSVPKMIIVKDLTNAENWEVYNAALGATKSFYLNATTVPFISSERWNDTSPTNSVFSLGTAKTNNNNANIIAYCFADVTSFSKFGNYTGNGNANGPFVYTGFKPAFIIVKRTDSANDWCLYDNKRDTFNVVQKKLNPNQDSAQSDDTSMDFVSNGFKLRETGGNFNADGGNYIYMVFAENPFVTSTDNNSIPSTAR